MSRLKTISDKLDYVAMGKLNAEQMEYICEISQEVNLKEREIERLTELCNKYEEEHKTTFETWQKDIKENELLHSIIKEVREIFKYYGVKEDIVGYSNYTITGEDLIKLLEILDKVGEE